MKGPKVISFMVKVQIVMTLPFVSAGILSCADGERNFTMQRDHESNEERKIELDRARALMKYAATCGGELFRTNQYSGVLDCTFEFASIEQMKDFADTVKTAVDGASIG